MATASGTITGVSLLRAKESLKTYLVTVDFAGSYTGASDTAEVANLGATIASHVRNGKSCTLKSVQCIGAGKSGSTEAFFTGTAAWAATISSDAATGQLSVAACTEHSSLSEKTVGVELAVTVLES